MDVVLVLTFLALSNAFLQFKVEPKSSECLFEELENGENVEIEFEVVRGGLLDIKVKVVNPQRELVVDKLAFFNRKDEELNEAESKLSFQATTAGLYSICMDNTMSRWTPKVVTYDRKDEGGSQVEIKPVPTEDQPAEELETVVASVSKISNTLDKITTLQHHMRVREQSHRDASEIINSRVQWLALFESCILITVSGFQIYYIRTWFADTKRVGGV